MRNTGYTIGDTIDRLDTKVTDIYSLHELALPSYSDQVLPFDITLAGANEYGAMCAAKILGVEILNEGSGISVDDAVSEALAGRLRPGLSVLWPFMPPSESATADSPVADVSVCCSEIYRQEAVAIQESTPGTG